MSFRDVLIILNAVAVAAIVVFIVYRVLSLRRNPEPRPPQNLTPFFEDDVLEGPKLERVLAVSLVMITVSVLVLVGYFLWEPFRAQDAKAGYSDRSIHRGAVLFADPSSRDYDSTKSLQCAKCHGSDGGGGTAPFTLKSEDPACDPNATVTEQYAAQHPDCLPVPVAWAAPNLQLAGLRYSSAQLYQIITYGRPGTPMPAWGVKSGRGPKDDQSIRDLVNYVESLKTTPSKAQAQAATDVAAVRTAAATSVRDHQKALADAQAAAAALPVTASADDRRIAAEKVTSEQTELAAAITWNQQMQAASDGQILFQSNCARCHTKGWSYFDPTSPAANPAPGPMGGGAYGPNLRQGDVNRQFTGPNGDADLYQWISEGVDANQGYGARGISSGRMPHFGQVLKREQICEIMEYERNIESPPNPSTQSACRAVTAK
jgi:mono/diheme cytochrome c family protein